MHHPPDEVLRQIATFVTDDFRHDQALLNLMRLIIESFARYLAAQTQLQLRDPMVTARIFIGSIVHYLLIQNVLHGHKILPLERDRLVDGLVQMITALDTSTSAPEEAP